MISPFVEQSDTKGDDESFRFISSAHAPDIESCETGATGISDPLT